MLWASFLTALTALGVGLHSAIASSHGEQSFDTAVAVQFLSLALHGWAESGIQGTTAFGDHFNPIFLLPAPLFAAWPSALCLQAFKVLCLVASLPAYARLARRLVGERAAVWAPVLVALSPLFWHALLSEYHTETVAAALIPWLLLAYEEQRLGRCLALALVICLGKENLPLVVGGLGVLALVERRSPRWWLGLGGLGAAVFALGVFVVIPSCAPGGAGRPLHYAHLSSAAGWGALIAQPGLWQWLGLLFASCAGLILLAPRTVWPLVPLLLQHGLSVNQLERDLSFHYVAPILPLLAYAALCGTATLGPSARRKAGAALALITLVLLVAIGPAQRLRGLEPQPGAARLAARIPADAGVWTSVSTVTRLAARQRVFMVESLTSRRYPSKPWPFDLNTIGPLPRHGLIDARDVPRLVFPSNLAAVEASGDLVRLGEGPARLLVRRPSDERFQGAWGEVPSTPIHLQPTDGGYLLALDRPVPSLPLVQVRLVDAAGRARETRTHRLGLGLPRGSGVWKVRYTPPAFEAAPFPAQLFVRFDPTRDDWLLLATYSGKPSSQAAVSSGER